MIAILMSTYYGEKHVGAQIESILGQTYTDWRLYIRDDGSKDDTQRIINGYVERYPDKIFLVRDDLGNLKAGVSFMHLLDVIDADYYMFCDQDDIWLPMKIEKTYRKMREVENQHKDAPTQISICVFSDLCVVGENLEVLHDSFWKSNKRDPEDAKDLYKSVSGRQPFLGCTMMMNRKVKDLVFPINEFVINSNSNHDSWIGYILAAKGEMAYVDEPLMLYRQHGRNVTDYQKRTQTPEDVIKSIILRPVYVVRMFVKRRAALKLLPVPVYFPNVVWGYVKRWVKQFLQNK